MKNGTLVLNIIHGKEMEIEYKKNEIEMVVLSEKLKEAVLSKKLKENKNWRTYGNK